LVKVDDGTVISDDELKSVAVTINDGYILVDCVDGVCKQTQGYVVDGSKIGIAFKGSSNGVTTAGNGDYEIDSNVACGTGNIGMIKSDNSEVCSDISTIQLYESSFGKCMIVNNAVIGNPFYDDTDGVLVKHGFNYVIVDMFESGKKYIWF